MRRMLRNVEKFSCVRKKRDLKLIAKLKLLKASRLIKKWSNINDLKRLGFINLIFFYILRIRSLIFVNRGNHISDLAKQVRLILDATRMTRRVQFATTYS